MREDGPLHDAAARLKEAAAAKKCWPCGCLHHALEAIERAVPLDQRFAEFATALETARARLEPVRYDCLGCDVCYPALALNALARAGSGVMGDVCPSEAVQPRAGWPPLPGSYTVFRYQAPVAVCALTDEDLVAALTKASDANVAIVGTVQTENLGIERVITNVLANPNIRFLIVAGADSRQAVGHLPGQSLVALATSGVDGRGRIVGACGKRPFLRNVGLEAIAHFRRTVEVVDRIGQADVRRLIDDIAGLASRNPGPADALAPENLVVPIKGYTPTRLVSDPAGYFVVYVDGRRRLLSLEHFRNDGVLDGVIEGKSAVELYGPAIERGFVSRLDHAAYLGRELARAERSLETGERYVQDRAPEQPLHTLQTECACSAASVPCTPSAETS